MPRRGHRYLEDIVDRQARVGDRLRWLEVGPGPRRELVPPGWDPNYGELDELSRIAYAMLPFCAFTPSDLPAIPPQAQWPAIEMWNHGFTSGSYMSRAFMRAMLCCGGLCVPLRINSWGGAIGSGHGSGGMAQRVGGHQNDDDGSNWRAYPASRLVYWATAIGQATPPPDEYQDAGGTFRGFQRFEWRGGSPAFPVNLNAPASFNEPGISKPFHGKGPYASFTGYTYWASDGGSRLQIIRKASAGYFVGTPPNESYRPCATTNHRQVGWPFVHDPQNGLIDHSGPSQAPWCFENQPSAATETGFWIVAAADFDILAGGFALVPPRFYRGEPVMSHDSQEDDTVVYFPGWDAWRARVAEWCYGTPDWVANVLPWYRAHQPRLSVTFTPSEHWQRAATFMPWLGKVEYRIWQRVMYLRGELYNPFVWGGDIINLPPGVVPVNDFGRFRVMGSDQIPYAMTYQPPQEFVGRPYHRLTYAGTIPSRPDTPDTMIFDGCAIPVKINPPYVD